MIQEISAFLRNTCILAIYIDKRVWEILSPKTCICVYNIHVLGFFPPTFFITVFNIYANFIKYVSQLPCKE